jgi:hypothetical protein
VNPDPLWLLITCLYGQARQRIRSALDGDPQSGALSLEWIVIASILVVAAVAAGIFFKSKISQWESNVP